VLFNVTAKEERYGQQKSLDGSIPNCLKKRGTMAEMPAIHLPIGRYRATFTFAVPPRFSDFPGSAWRGALGYAFKRTVCATNRPSCADCLLYHTCLYPYFYDTPPAPDAARMRRYTTAPHPYVLDPEGVTENGVYRLGFTLIGKSNRHLAVFLHALTRAAQSPKGVATNHFTLLAVEQERALGRGAWQSIYRPGQALTAAPPIEPDPPPVPEGCTIEFHTPLRVKRNGQRVNPEKFGFVDLFGNVLRRVSMLCAHHTDTLLEIDFRGLMAAARELSCETDLGWHDRVRYSARQKTVLRMGGVSGKIRITGQDLTPFWPFLWLGQWVHAGSGATMGLGRYTIAASLPTSQQV